MILQGTGRSKIINPITHYRNLPKGQTKIKDFVWVNPDKKGKMYLFSSFMQ